MKPYKWWYNFIPDFIWDWWFGTKNARLETAHNFKLAQNDEHYASIYILLRIHWDRLSAKNKQEIIDIFIRENIIPNHTYWKNYDNQKIVAKA